MYFLATSTLCCHLVNLSLPVIPVDVLYRAAIKEAMMSLHVQLPSSLPQHSHSITEDAVYQELQHDTHTVHQEPPHAVSVVDNKLTCIVVGAGLGPLPDLCLKAAQETGIDVHVHAVDANPIAVSHMRDRFRDSPKVIVHDAFTLYPNHPLEELPPSLRELSGNCHIAVSELLGCFGDDEFLPELTRTVSALFLKPDCGISIPQSWTSYVCPVQADSMYTGITMCKWPLDTAYVAGLTGDCVYLAEPIAVWTGSCSAKVPYPTDQVYCADRTVIPSPFMVRQQKVIQEYMTVKMKESKLTKTSGVCGEDAPSLKGHEYVVHGLLGYFTSCLFGDIVIDTRHCSVDWNCFHWECYFMPLPQPLPLHVADDLTVCLERHYTEASREGQHLCELCYSWSVKITCLPPVKSAEDSHEPLTLFGEVKYGGLVSM